MPWQDVCRGFSTPVFEPCVCVWCHLWSLMVNQAFIILQWSLSTLVPLQERYNLIQHDTTGHSTFRWSHPAGCEAIQDLLTSCMPGLVVGISVLGMRRQIRSDPWCHPVTSKDMHVHWDPNFGPFPCDWCVWCIHLDWPTKLRDGPNTTQVLPEMLKACQFSEGLWGVRRRNMMATSFRGILRSLLLGTLK